MVCGFQVEVASRSPFDPLPGENEMVRGNVFIEMSEVITLESYLLQIMVIIEWQLANSLPL